MTTPTSTPGSNIEVDLRATNSRTFDVSEDYILEARAGAIPDSSLYHYPIPDRQTSTITEVLTGADATANGTTNVFGNWEEGYAESGNGSSAYIGFPTELNTWVNPDGENKWLAFTVDAAPQSARVFGLNDTAQSPSEFFILAFESDGIMKWRIRDQDDDGDDISTNNPVLDGSKKRILIQRTGNGSSGMEIWVNGVNQPVSEDLSQGADGGFGSSAVPYFLAINQNGGSSDNVDTTVDNILFGAKGTTLTESEIQADYDAQPWS